MSTDNNKRRVIGLLAIFLLAFLLRGFYVLFLSPPEYSYDGRIYQMLATNVIEGRGFCYSPGFYYSWRPPLYSLFLAALYSVFGSSDIYLVRIVQSILGSLTCVIVYFIGKNIFNRIVGYVSSIITAFHPFLIWYTAEVMSETLFIFIVSLLILSLLQFIEKQEFKNQCICGLLLGLSALTRPMMLLFPVIILVWTIFLFPHKIVPVFSYFFVICLIMLLTVMPWTIRNYFIHKEFVLISTNGGFNFWLGNSPFATGTMPIFQQTLDDADSSSLSEKQKDTKYYQLGFNFIGKNPKRFLHLVLEKFCYFWSPVREAKGHSLYHNFEYLLYLLGMIGAIAALIRKNKKSFLLIVSILYFMGIYMLYFASLRFRIPIMPYVIILASSPISLLVLRIKKLIKHDAL